MAPCLRNVLTISLNEKSALYSLLTFHLESPGLQVSGEVCFTAFGEIEVAEGQGKKVDIQGHLSGSVG